MSYGLEVTSAIDGRIILDANFSQLFFAGKAPSSAPAYQGNGVAGFSYSATATISGLPVGVDPVVFYYAPIGTYIKIQGIYAASTTSYNINYWSNNSNAADIYIFYAGIKAPQSSEPYGMRVFDSNSQAVYDTGWKVARVQQIAYFNAVSNGTTLAFAAGMTKPAILFRSPFVYIFGTTGQALSAGYYFCGLSNATTLKIIQQWAYWFSWSGTVDYTFGDGRARNVPIIDGAEYD